MDILMLSKIFALLLYFPLFCGIILWAYGPNSRERIYTLRLTFECFLWQLLKPKTPCREVVRQVQALFQLHGKGDRLTTFAV